MKIETTIVHLNGKRSKSFDEVDGRMARKTRCMGCDELVIREKTVGVVINRFCVGFCCDKKSCIEKVRKLQS